MKICITTSDNYHHLLPIFFKCYNRHWGDPFDLVGYKKPDMELPDNCTWVSLGVQRGPKFFSDDKREYFKNQPDHFVWMMEDTFIKGFDAQGFDEVCSDIYSSGFKVDKFNLTNESMRRPCTLFGDYFLVDQSAKYRLSTQPAIWSRTYLLKYLTPGLSPWDFETQPQQDDDLKVWGVTRNIVEHNEGVTRHDIHKLNLDGIEI